MLGDDADELETYLWDQAEELRSRFGEPAPFPLYQDILDSYEYLALLVRHRHDYREGNPEDGTDPTFVTDRFTGICHKCEVFPIDLVAGAVCPECGSNKWLSVTRC